MTPDRHALDEKGVHREQKKCVPLLCTGWEAIMLKALDNSETRPQF